MEAVKVVTLTKECVEYLYTRYSSNTVNRWKDAKFYASTYYSAAKEIFSLMEFSPIPAETHRYMDGPIHLTWKDVNVEYYVYRFGDEYLTLDEIQAEVDRLRLKEKGVIADGRSVYRY